MRTLLIVVALFLPAGPARAEAQKWSPLRVYIECQSWGRTKACPAFLRGFLDETPVLEWAPRADADVWLLYNVTFDAQDDLVHLRYRGRGRGMPKSYEVEARISSRGTDDEQRSQLLPAFQRGVAPFVGVVAPEAVQVALIVPPNGHQRKPATTAWGFNMWAGGWGSWSEMFKSAHSWAGTGVSRKTADHQFWLNASGSYRLSRQPPLIIDDEEVSLDSDTYSVEARSAIVWNLTPRWSSGVLVRGGHEDSEGRYEKTARAHAAASYDWFPSDDPRGNLLAIGYFAGYQVDDYSVRNVLDENVAHFPTHGVLARGSVRKDKISYGIRASAMAMMFEPRTRYVLDVEPNISIKLGDHIDLNFSVGVTKQAVPGPADIDTTDFEEVTRASYTDPLRLSSSFNLNVHWDRTNGARNNRLSLTGRLGSISTL